MMVDGVMFSFPDSYIRTTSILIIESNDADCAVDSDSELKAIRLCHLLYRQRREK